MTRSFAFIISYGTSYKAAHTSSTHCDIHLVRVIGLTTYKQNNIIIFLR